MERRSFFAGLAGLVAGRAVPPAVTPPEVAHFYAWGGRLCPRDRTVTSDPRWADKELPYGACNHVSVDGTEVGTTPEFRVQALVTGPEGWAEGQLFEPEGGVVLEVFDTWAGAWVDLPAGTQFQQYDNRRCTVEGLPIPRWGEERPKVRRLYGHVRYWVDPPTPEVRAAEILAMRQALLEHERHLLRTWPDITATS